MTDVITIDDPPIFAEKAKTDSVQARALPAPWETDGLGILPRIIINMAQAADGITPWSEWPIYRDMQLFKLGQVEPILAGTIYNFKARIKSLPYKVIGKPRTETYFMDMFETCEFGEGLPILAEKVVDDLLTHDNGAFIEIHGPGRPDRELRGMVTSISHMDSSLCWRTFDPVYPVLYQNPYTGEFHKMHHTRVISLSNNVSSRELARGIGFCAVSRVLRSVQIMRDIWVYKGEKVGGQFKRAIGYGSGLTPKQFDSAVRQAEDRAEASGLTHFMEIPFIVTPRDDITLGLLDLASLPDNYDVEKDTTIYVYMVALGFGTDARELWPATSSGATKADASIQHIKAQGKGVADLIKTIEGAIKRKVIKRENGVFEYDFTDDEADLRSEQVKTAKISNVNSMRNGNYISETEGRAILIAEGVLNEEMLMQVNAPPVLDAPETEEEDAPPGSKEIRGQALPANQVTDVPPITEAEQDATFALLASLPALPTAEAIDAA